jgi:hypothetical protein
MSRNPPRSKADIRDWSSSVYLLNGSPRANRPLATDAVEKVALATLMHL